MNHIPLSNRRASGPARGKAAALLAVLVALAASAAGQRMPADNVFRDFQPISD
jgi:hypothetical protein